MRRGFAEHEQEAAAAIAATSKVPLEVLDRLVALRRSPVGQTGRNNARQAARTLIEELAAGKAPKPTPRRASPGRRTVHDDALTDIGEGSRRDVRIVRFELRNYAQFVDTALDLRRIPGRHVYIATALNGVGKSRLIEALQYTLFGRRGSNRFKRSDITARVPVHATGNELTMRLALELETDEGPVTITRVNTLRRRGEEWEPPLQDDVVVTVDGEALRGDEAEEWLAHRFPPRVLDYFVFDAESGPVLGLSAGQDVRGELENALGLAELRIVRKWCLAFGDEWEREATEEDGPTPEVLDNQARLAQSQAEDARRQLEAAQTRLTERQSRLGRLDDDAARLGHRGGTEAARERLLQTTIEADYGRRIADGERRRERWLTHDLPLELVEDWLGRRTRRLPEPRRPEPSSPPGSKRAAWPLLATTTSSAPDR